jgi:hypothetical protein
MLHEDAANYYCYGIESYCERCYGGCDCADCQPDYDEDFDYEVEPLGMKCTTRSCGSYKVHFDLDREVFLCDHLAVKAEAEGREVKRVLTAAALKRQLVSA